MTTTPLVTAEFDAATGGPVPGEHGLMVVTVRDRSRERPWGSGLTDPRTSTVAIADHCPACLAADVVTMRGRPFGTNSHDDGVTYWVQVWQNDCGHTDYYEQVVIEAAAITAARGPGRWVRIYPTAEAETAHLARDAAAAATGTQARVWRDDHAPHELADQHVLVAARALDLHHPTPGVLAIQRHTTHRLRLLTATRDGVVDYRWTPPDRATAGHLAGQPAPRNPATTEDL